MIQVMNPQGFSFSQGICFSDERQFGLRKDHMPVELSSNYSGYYSHSNGAPDSINSGGMESFESLDEVEAQTIGNLLPDDDDLFSGVTDGFDTVARHSNVDETEDLDLFSSVGGFELGDGEKFALGATGGKHHVTEHPSRTLFVRNINSNVEDSELMIIFEQYGDIRKLYTACKHRGFVMISYYDIRAACNAMKALQNKPLRCQKLDVHFSIPKENPTEQDINQGALAILNLDSSVSNNELLKIFYVYGEVKEIRETSNQSNHRFVEFYDVRAAEAAFSALNKIEISGKQIQMELCSFSENGTMLGANGSLVDHVVHNGVPSSSSDSPTTLLRAEPAMPTSTRDSDHINNHLNFEIQSPNFNAHSLPEYNNAFSNFCRIGGSPGNVAANFSSQIPEIVDGQQFCRVFPNRQALETQVFGSAGSGNFPPGCSYMRQQPQSIPWPITTSFVNGIGIVRPQQMHSVPRAPHIVPMNNHHVGSAPAVNPPIWDRHNAYAGESSSPDVTLFLPGSLGNMRISSNSSHPLDFVPINIFSHAAPNGIPSKSIGVHSHHQRCMAFLASVNERSSHHRNEGNLIQADKKQFELDIERIICGEDKRTTLMIKNIPNKYTSKMLLAAIDECHRGTYDFIYLPIDFKNKCNVGYAFINMTEPSLIVPLHKAFNGKKWEKFNSEKVASIAYARIQGKAALIAHFQNSSLMNEDKRCRPILFHTDGPNAGDQVPFPIGSNIRSRPGKLRTNSSSEENAHNSVIGDDCSNEDLCSASAKEA